VDRGFDYASFSQIARLLHDAGFSPAIDNYDYLRSDYLLSGLPSAIAFVDDFGPTLGASQARGFMAPFVCDYHDEVTTCTDYVSVTASTSRGSGFAGGDDGTFVTRAGQAHVGSFLIREVPEPATGTTLLAGLGLFAALLRCQRRAAARA
jgi:hypothetical protein